MIPFEWAFRLQVVLPPLLSAIAMSYLLRVLGRSRLSSLFGAVCWGFGGFFLSTTDLLPWPSALAPVPLALAGAHLVARRPGVRGVGVAALGIGLVLITGEPTLPFALALLLPAAFVAGLRVHAKTVRAAAARATAAVVLGACLAGATLVPGVAHVAKTSRIGGLDAAEAGLWSFPPARLLEIAAPHAVALDAARYPGRGQPYIASIYPGVAALILAAVAFVFRARRLWPWLAAAAAGLLLAFGTATPLWGAARRVVPFFGGLRFPEKLVIVPLVCLVVLSAHGCDLLRRRRVARTAAILGAALAAAALVLSPLARSGRIAPAPADLLRTAAVSILVALLAAAGPRRPRTAAALLALVAAADLLSAGRGLVHTAPASSVASPPSFLAAALSPPLPGPLFVNVSPSLEPLVRPPIPARWGLATVFDIDYDQTELRWSVDATRRFYLAVEQDPSLLGPLLARRGVAALLRDAPPGAPAPIVLLRTAGRRPFAFFAERVSFVVGPEGWSREVARLGPLAATTVCLYEADRAKLREPPGAGAILSARRRPDRLELEVKVDGPRPALLAVNQTWDRGWRASIDGRAAETVVADVSLTALVVPPGSRRVVLCYRSPAVWAGLALSAAGVLAAAALLARPAQKG